MSRRQTAESFWARVERKPSGCWEWTGCVNTGGYGNVVWDQKCYVTHRVAAWLSGLITNPSAPLSSKEPTHVLHKCDNRRCCNPEHFFLGSFSDNMFDAYQKGRKKPAKGHKHANSKLTKAQVLAIRRRYARGEKQVPLAAEYGITQGAVSKLLLRKTYTEY